MGKYKEILTNIKGRAVDLWGFVTRKGKPELKFRLLGRFWFYLFLIAAATVFTQALRSPVSSVILVFLLLLPLTSLLYLLIGVLTVKVYLDAGDQEVEKYTPVDFTLTVANESPLPYPFVEARISLPADNAVRCVSQLTKLSLIPRGRYVVAKTLSFAYRGGYDIGVSDVYVYDLFRLFRYRLDVSLFRQIFVLPRRLQLAGHSGADPVSELTESVSRMSGSDNTEMSDIRQYQIGDSLRSIHWKLSSKTEELQVREYARNSEHQSIIFCDTGRRFAADSELYTDDVGEFVADGVIETAIALTRYTLEQERGAVTLVWFDSRSESGVFGIHISSPAEFDDIFRTFATAPISDAPATLAYLASLVVGGEQAAYRFVTGTPDAALASELAEVGLPGTGSIELYTYLPLEKIKEGARERCFDALEAAQNEIARLGIRIIDARDSDLFTADVVQRPAVTDTPLTGEPEGSLSDAPAVS